MANNYVQFSEMLTCDDKEALLDLYTRISQSAEDEDGDYVCSAEMEDDGLWLYADEYGDIDVLADIIATWQVEHRIDKVFTITWSETCSKPRLREFGGGFVAIYKGEVIAGNVWDAAYDAAKRLMEEAK